AGVLLDHLFPALAEALRDPGHEAGEIRLPEAGDSEAAGDLLHPDLLLLVLLVRQPASGRGEEAEHVLSDGPVLLLADQQDARPLAAHEHDLAEVGPGNDAGE